MIPASSPSSHRNTGGIRWREGYYVHKKNVSYFRPYHMSRPRCQRTSPSPVVLAWRIVSAEMMRAMLLVIECVE